MTLEVGNHQYTIEELEAMNIPETDQFLLFGAPISEIKKVRKSITTWIKLESIFKK